MALNAYHSLSNCTPLSKKHSGIDCMINACCCFKRLSVCVQDIVTEDLAECECRVGREQEMAGADLVHDNIVDGVFIIVLVVAQPH